MDKEFSSNSEEAFKDMSKEPWRSDNPTPISENPQEKPAFVMDPEFIDKLKAMIGRRKNIMKLDKKVRHNQIKMKKSKRRISNKNRKINQDRNRHNKFTK